MERGSTSENFGTIDERIEVIKTKFAIAEWWRSITPDVRAVVTRDENGRVKTRKLVRV